MTVFGAVTSGKMTIPKASLDWKVLPGLEKGTYSNVILYSFSEQDSETIDVRRCFQDVNHIFAFGRDTERSLFTVNLLCFLGEMCGGGAQAKISNLKSLYDNNRIYKNPNPISITIDQDTIKGYLTQLTIGQVDARTQSCVVSYTFIIDQEA